jgi:hypothetical protein
MRTIALILCGMLVAPLSFHVSPASAEIQQLCNVDADVTDADPKGTNVRAAPGGAILTTVTNPNVEGWVQVHITGQLGDWYEISRAALVNPDLGREGKTLFHGKGYLHKSVLGVSGLNNDAKIYTAHDEKSRPLDLHAPGDQTVEMLGCWGDFLQVHVKKGTGWTKEACTNMDTTCS